MGSLRAPLLILIATAIYFGALVPSASAQGQQRDMMLQAAYDQIGKTVHYDGSYSKLKFPGGDVPIERGVCTDVIIRAMRATGIDLQKAVNDDMRAHFNEYPRIWGLESPDSNIDHRRVPNLQTFFRRQGTSLPVGTQGGDYKPGDFVTWTLPNQLPHIGIVSDKQAPGGRHMLIVHNIGAGAQLEDVLFAFTISGHYRYFRN